MSGRNKSIENGDYGDLPSDFLASRGKELLINKINSSDIKEDEDGNCTLAEKKIEANACNMLKEDYEI